MSARIKAGDLVMVVKPAVCIGGALGIGYVYQVLDVITHDRAVCVHCGRSHGHVEIALEKEDLGVETWRLQRLDPPAESVTRVTKEEIKA